jgi:hypothetical protein
MKRISNRRLWSTKEGVGETSGQTAGPQFSTGLSLWRKPARQKKEVFFIGADPKVRNFTGAVRPLRFGPDVFADALVPQAGALSPGVLISENCQTPNPARSRLHAGRRCGNGYRFAKRQGKPNSANPAVTQQNKRFAILRRARREIRSDSIHREV